VPARAGVGFPRDLGAGDLAVCWRVAAADAGEVEDGVEGGFEGTGVALDLGEEETALERGEEGATARSSGSAPFGRCPAS